MKSDEWSPFDKFGVKKQNTQESQDNSNSLPSLCPTYFLKKNYNYLKLPLKWEFLRIYSNVLSILGLKRLEWIIDLTLLKLIGKVYILKNTSKKSLDLPRGLVLNRFILGFLYLLRFFNNYYSKSKFFALISHLSLISRVFATVQTEKKM